LKLNEAICVWVESALIANMDLNQTALLTKAKTFAIVLNITDFKESLNKHRECLQAICEEMHPLKTLAHGLVLGYKKNKARVTVMFLDAFDKIKATGSSALDEFNILDAINATSDAWDNACQQLELELKNEFDELDILIINLAVSSKIDDPMDVREFVDVDTNIAFEILSDDDIIYNIKSKDDHPTEEKILEPVPKITDYDALKALDLIEMYLL
ncbi:10388_t:CDS:2, partial [Scutellospora calospora]